VSSKVAVITGASRGLGYSLARRFAQEGCDLAIISRNIEKLEYAKKKIIESHPEVKVLPLKCDLRDQSEITNAISKIDKTFRRIDTLINNAGVRSASSVLDMSLQMWEDTIDTNLTSVFLMVKYSLPLLEKSSKPIIINLSSVRGLVGHSDLSAYSASKFGIIGFTQSLADELKNEGIEVYCICPGAIDTEMIKNVNCNIPREKLIQPAKLADIIYGIVASPYEPSGKTVIVIGRQKELLVKIVESNQYKIIKWD
jgi:NAD(P)-dependent dehydrogenase (short-subunit alcohol dehydrogenase family)